MTARGNTRRLAGTNDTVDNAACWLEYDFRKPDPIFQREATADQSWADTGMAVAACDVPAHMRLHLDRRRHVRMLEFWAWVEEPK